MEVYHGALRNLAYFDNVICFITAYYSVTMYHRLYKCIVVQCSLSQMLTIHCSLLNHITAYNIVVQSNILCLCTLQCVKLVYSLFEYNTMNYSRVQCATLYYIVYRIMFQCITMY